MYNIFLNKKTKLNFYINFKTKNSKNLIPFFTNFKFKNLDISTPNTNFLNFKITPIVTPFYYEFFKLFYDFKKKKFKPKKYTNV